MSAALVAGLATASAQTVAADSVMQHVNGKRLSVGGYGEVAMSRNFYSDAGKRYSNATAYKKRTRPRTLRHSSCSNLPGLRLRKGMVHGY